MTRDADSSNRQTDHLGRLLFWPFLALVLLWVPMTTGLEFPSKMDELIFHVPQVQRFAERAPTWEDLQAPELAMLPLFHMVLGRLAAFTSSDLVALRLWMMAIGAGVLLGFLMAAKRLGGGGSWRYAVLGLAAFPYFGVGYFVVLTDYPALLGFVFSLLGQVLYLQTRRESALWLAGFSALLAVLVRQNQLFVIGPILGVLALRRLFARETGRAEMLPFYRELVPLSLPVLGLAFQVWLWHGLLPPATMDRPNYFDARITTYVLGLMSVAGDSGYYFWPLAAAFWGSKWRRGTALPWGTLVWIGAFAAAGTAYGLSLRGTDLVSTYGTFRHALGFLSGFGLPAAAVAVLALSLFSFGTAFHLALSRAIRGGVRRPEAILLILLLTASILAVSFGTFRIYERYVLPVVASLALIWSRKEDWRDSRWRHAGWAASLLFALANSIVYSVSVYEL